MNFQRLADYLTKRGYIRALYNFEPCLVKMKAGHKVGEAALFAKMEGEHEPVDHAVSVWSIMDWIVLERWDFIATEMKLNPVEVLALMMPEE